MEKNERKNEAIVRNILKNLNYEIIEEQKSDNKTISETLKKASKTQNNGNGFPDFIARKAKSDTIIIFECKSSNNNHGSILTEDFDYNNYKAIANNATNGIIHYMKFLKEKYNVIGIATSGETEKNFKVSIFKQEKGNNKVEYLNIEEIKSFEVFENLFKEKVNLKKDEDIKIFSKQLNLTLYSDMNLSVEYRAPFITAIILALLDEKFEKGWNNCDDGKELADEMVRASKKTLLKNGFSEKDSDTLIKNFAFIQSEKSIIDAEIYGSPLSSVINDINKNILTLLKENHGLDIIGSFYTEFLRYINGDKGDLGIVLTPKHICELMSEMIYLNKESRVIDLCSGTGGFLVSSINEMTKLTDDIEKIKNIKNNQTLGIELQSKMYLLLVSNMIVRGNYDNNLLYGSCFDFETEIKTFKPDRALQNPPYSQKDSELKFIKYTMDLLEKGGYGAFIVPKSVAFKKNKETLKYKEDLLKEHTLIASCSLNDNLFTPTGTCPIILIFKAHEPHIDIKGKPLRKTFIADWSDDGHEVKKNCGRVDNGHWKEIKKEWLENYRNTKETEKSQMVNLVANDEWLYEAFYNNTDDLIENDFLNTILDYLIYEETCHG